jgi:acetyl-CoA carboxylase carboxyltransferase component
MPVVGLMESAGARLQEAMYGLGGYGRIFAQNVALSGLVPQISIVTGTCAGGGAYSPALTDFVVMAKSSVMFLTGPRVVRDAVGEDLTPEALGGPRVHQKNGVCDFVVATELDAVLHARKLLSYLPQNRYEPVPLAEPIPPLPGDPSEVLPGIRTAVYDVKDAIARIVDGGRLVEASPRWAQNMVTGLARIDGRPVGIVANQPRHLGGVIEVEACQKAASFIHTCDSYGLPLVVCVDTPGFMPGSKQEKIGIIRHGAELVRAFAGATVPRITVVLRKAYGGAYIAMNSKDLGASLTFAWRDAEIGVMGAPQAVEVVHRRELERAENRAELLEALSRNYEAEHCTADGAACSGFVDEVIEPAQTRDRLIAALNTFSGQLEARASVHRLGS